MARYGNYQSSGYSGYRQGGFTKSNGVRVSAARASQHVGQTFGGYTKVSTSQGGFRMVKNK